MAKTAATQQYVVLPPRGLRALGPAATPRLQAFLGSAQPGSFEVARSDGGAVRLQVIDSIGHDGAKLIETTPEEALALRSAQPSVRIAPILYYSPAVAPRRQVRAPVMSLAQQAPSTTPVTVRVVSESDNAPVAGAYVLAFTNLAAGAGAQAVTDSDGRAQLDLDGPSVPVERLYVYPVTAFWTIRQVAITRHRRRRGQAAPARPRLHGLPTPLLPQRL